MRDKISKIKEPKLFVLLKSLSADEFKWFYKFVKSPYYNANNHLVRLYELLRKYYPDFKHPKLTHEALFAGLFPNKVYDIQRMRLLFHRMSKLVEAFLVAQELKSDDFLYKKLVTKSFGRMNTYDLFQKKTHELLTELDASSLRDEFFYKHKEEINLQFYAHPATNRQQKATAFLTDAMESLDTYFVLSKIKLACALKAREQTFSESFDIKYLNVVHEHSKNANLLVLIYYRILELQSTDENVNVFEDVRTLFAENLEKIGQEDKRNILQILLNFCTRLVNKGKSKFIQYMLELYKIGLEYNCLFINNELSETTFNNIVTSGIGCKEYEWTKSFIEAYGQYLNKLIRQDAITYSWAVLNFNKQEFEKTIDLILNHQFTKPLQIVITKTLLIRTYVELFLQNESYYDLSIAQLNTFEKYIRSNKFVSERATEGYLNFTRFTKKLVNLKVQRKSLHDFKHKLTINENLILKNWLLAKIEVQE